MWISVLFYGSIMSIVIWVVQRRRLNSAIRISCLLLASSLLFFYYYLFKTEFLGHDSWYNQTPYQEIIYLVLMWMGMGARYVTKIIEDRRELIAKRKKENVVSVQEKIKVELDPWEFSYPFLFSVLTFSLLLKQIEVEQLTVANIAISFQSGFFWQTVLKKEVSI